MTTKQSLFNWDDIDVGNKDLNNSENFFAQKHLKHEKFFRMDFVSEQLAEARLDDDGYNPFDRGEFNLENKENVSPERSQEKVSPKLPSRINTPVTETQVVTGEVVHDARNLDKSANPSEAPPNVASAWTPGNPAVVKTAAVVKNRFIGSGKPIRPPQAYEFKDVYERKKQETLKKILDEERKMRQFQSRPAPNFSTYHEQLERRQKVHCVTVPATPNVLKKSRETEEKHKKKIEELKRQYQPIKFHSREPTVLKEEPFVPKKTQTVIQSRPFNLRSERRLQERKQYDAAAQNALEEKLKQVQNAEEERKKREEQEFKELRKMATFKARPNPFK